MKMDGRATCYRCGGEAHDYVSSRKAGEMTLQCCYCLAMSNVFGYPPDEPKKPQSSGRYVLKHGRHKGSTIEEVANLGDRGVEYLRILSRESPKLTEIIEQFLNSRSAVSDTAAASLSR